MRTYVINLPRATARWERISAHLTALGIPYERIEAVEGAVLSPREIRAAANRVRFRLLHARRLQPAELGCALSHQRAYAQLAADGAGRALILEDDAAVDPARLAEAVADFETIDPAVLRIHLLSSRKTEGLPAAGTHPVDDRAMCATAYLITAAAAARLRRVNMPVFTLADDWRVWKSYGIAVFRVTPFAVTECGAESQIAWKRPLRARWRWYRALWRLRHWIGGKIDPFLFPRKRVEE